VETKTTKRILSTNLRFVFSTNNPSQLNPGRIKTTQIMQATKNMLDKCNRIKITAVKSRELINAKLDIKILLFFIIINLMQRIKLTL